MKKLTLILVMCVFAVTGLKAQNIEGTWKTIDDETGKAKSHVTIYESNGAYFGKVSKILNKDRQDATCELCNGSLKDKPILGMIIIRDLQKINDSKYANGKILDPNKGKEYHLKIFPGSDDETLTLEGSIKVMGMSIGRKQTWYRVN